MSLGPTEIIFIFLAILLLFGAKRIPEIARGLGKGIREFKDATNDIKRELDVSEHPPPRQIHPPAAQPQTQPSQPVTTGTTPPPAPPAPPPSEGQAAQS
jgi:sec-independent protein translocase protein TatA